jgi:EAL domain-containing protein (putative c-di-GMP-specific phosphodiesterase class I)
MLREACTTARAWPAHLRLAINISPVQLRTGAFESNLNCILTECGLAPGRLEVEITETALLHENPTTRTALDTLRAIGCGISLDDFGTGYSSLSYVRRYRPDRIKIDRSFVSEICSDPETLSIVRAVVDLALELGMATTAEGVETVEQYRLLQQIGCTEMQGYLFSRPQSAVDVAELLRSGGGMGVPEASQAIERGEVAARRRGAGSKIPL